MHIVTKRIYEPPENEDGTRILVDRLWARGISKTKAKVDLWLKDIAPTASLRKWFGHDPEKWDEFRKRYRSELGASQSQVKTLKDLASKGSVTLLYAAKDTTHNNAVVLKEYLET